MNRWLQWCGRLALALCLGAIGLTAARAQSAPLSVVASFSILGDMVREVGGDDIRLTVLVGARRDAHTFEPAPRDARELGEAQVLVVNGLGFESWLPRLIQASGFHGREIVASAGVTPRHLDEESESAGHDPAQAAHGALDPHAWQDLSNGVIYVHNIARGLAQADPAHASAYLARAEAYARRLREADAQWRQALAAIPESRRVLATSHDAFGYFGAAYGIRLLSVVGLSGEAEPSARVMAQLIRQIRQQDIRALFLEQGGNSRALRQIAEETGVRPGGELYADTLAAPGQEASTYLGMFRWNTAQLLRVFTAP